MNATTNPAFCYATDMLYLAPTLMSIASLRNTLSASLPVFLILTLKEGENKPDLTPLIDQLSVQVINIDYGAVEGRSEIWASSHVSKAAIGRLLLHDLLPADIDRIVYLDGDTLVLKDLVALAAAPIPDGSVGMVEDAISFYSADKSDNGRSTREYLSRIGLRPDDPYGNSGVMVASRDDWRSLSLDALAYLQHSSERCPPYHDQSAINAVIGTRRINLSTKWNCQSRFAQWDRTALSKASLLHFTGAEKPWMGSVYPWQSIYAKITPLIARLQRFNLPMKTMADVDIRNHNRKYHSYTYVLRRYLDLRLRRRPQLLRHYDSTCLL